MDLALFDTSTESGTAKGGMALALVALAKGADVTYNSDTVTARTGM